MQNASKVRMRARASSLMHTLSLAFLGVVVFAGYAVAQTGPTGHSPKAEPGGKTQAEPASKAKTQTETKPESKAGVDESKEKTEVKPDAKQKTKAKDKAKLISTAKAKSKGQVPSRERKGGKATSGFQMDPNAKWVCDQPVASLDPVWRGDKKLTFAFDIRNEGTADLKIKARGG